MYSVSYMGKSAEQSRECGAQTGIAMYSVSYMRPSHDIHGIHACTASLLDAAALPQREQSNWNTPLRFASFHL